MCSTHLPKGRGGLLIFFVVALLSGLSSPAGAFAAGMVIERELRSANFARSKIGTDPVRKMAVYLPPGYDVSARRYPVIYFLPNGFEGHRFIFERGDCRNLFDAAIEGGVVREFILVSVGMNTPLGSSWSANSPVTGNWEDFVVGELVPYVDANFRTLPRRDSRGVAGDRMGGYGAIRFGMRHPEIFGSVYALHPVGTGSGVQIMYSRPDWDLLARAETLDDLKGDVLSSIFTAIFQAHLPNPDKAPLFIDLPARKLGDQLVFDTKLTARLHESFFLDAQIARYAENLKSLRGFKLDWGRGDANHDHVYANQSFTHKLDEFGIAHEAEEYRGGWGDKLWGARGRIYTDVLPFFQECLIFEGGGSEQ